MPLSSPVARSGSPTPPRAFDLATAPLRPGASLLEASAGTGKTWTIAGLYARLVAEQGLLPRQILAVTFTEAATAELRDRVRRRLADVRAALRAGAPSEDGAVLAARAAFAAGTLSPALADRRLAEALGGFDEAAIHTIHGFCQRLLREAAFACGTLFDLEIEPDSESLRSEAAADLWRSWMAPDPHCGLTGRLALAAGWSIDTVVKAHRAASRAGPGAKLHFGAGSCTLAEAEAGLISAIGAARASWLKHGGEVIAHLSGHPRVSVNKASGLPPARLAEFGAVLDGLRDDPDKAFSAEAIRAFAGLAQSHFLEGGAYYKKTGKDPLPKHPFLDVAEEVGEAFARWQGAAREAGFRALEDRMQQLAAERGVLTFDDLIARVYDTLMRDGEGDALANLVRSRYPAALIDEFQDTDDRQWAIFRRFFLHPGGQLHLIGDPKQAIYRFRGADIFAYLAARDEIAATDPGRIFTLPRNFRSRPDLVEAVNNLFAAAPSGFLGPDVDFHPVQAAANPPGVLLGDKPLPPLAHFRLDLGNAAPADAQRTALAAAATAYAARLLRSGTVDPDAGDSKSEPARPLTPEDIAVLVRTSNEARMVEEALRAHGLAAIRQTDESVWDTAEAADLLIVLSALRSPGDDAAWRRALATDLLGADAPRLDLLARDDQAWADELARAARWRDAWEEHSFIRAFRLLLAEADVRRRWLARPGGERALTNLLHLGELLHEIARRQHLGPDALLRAFRRARANTGSTRPAESHILRLETDSTSIRIVTVHRSKGLEYPIVLAPFHSLGLGTPDTDAVLWHAKDRTVHLDLSGKPDPEAVEAAASEAEDDEARILYVSLTRAKWHLAIFDTTAAPPRKGPGPLTRLFESVTANPVLMGPDEWAPATAPAAPPAAPPPTAPARSVLIPHDRLHESFSAIAADATREAAGHHPAAATPAAPMDGGAEGAASAAAATLPAADPVDRDAIAPAWPLPVPEEPAAGSSAPSIHNLPAGARTGDALHRVLETVLGPGGADASLNLEDLSRKAFARLLLPASHVRPTAAALAQVIAHPYPDPAGGPPLLLDQLAPADRRPEVAFQLPLRPVSPARLAAVLAGSPGLPADRAGLLAAIGRPLADGFLSGFLDLIARGPDGRFHLFDWKSNRLGPDASAYTAERIEAAMADHLYGLQYHLYLLALHRHLRRVLPGYDPSRHLGPVRYVFLRGLDPADPAAGIFTALPDPARLDALEELLCGDA